MDYSTRTRVMRTIRGISQLELQEITGIPNTYLSNIETGKMIPTAEWDAMIRRALGWTPAVDAALDALGEVVRADEDPAP